jgi:FlaG/FlaF family flagellin (archaellin)
MRQPTFTRRRTRQQRLLRTGIGVVVIVVLAALIANLAGGGKKKSNALPPGVAQVAFVATVKGETDAKPASKGAVTTQGTEIVTMLNDWYEQAFVDPDKYGDGTFPDITKHFTDAARTSFAKDLATLTIGDARKEVKRVDPLTQTAKVTVYFSKGKPTYAIAAVHFAARATMKQSSAYPLKIDQFVTYDFQKTTQGWVVTYYLANQAQNSIVPSPSPSASSS